MKEWAADDRYEASSGRKRPSDKDRRAKGYLNERRLAKGSSKENGSDGGEDEGGDEEDEDEDEGGDEEDEDKDEGGDDDDEDEDEGGDAEDEDEDDDGADEDGDGARAQLQSELQRTAKGKK